MDTLLVASSQPDAEAADAARQRHTELVLTLEAQVATLIAVVAQGDLEATEVARHRLVRWATDVALPVLDAEEQVVYPAARTCDEATLLLEVLVAGNRLIAHLVSDLADAPNGVTGAAKGEGLRVAMSSHCAIQDQQLLPLLARVRTVSLSTLVGGVSELLDSRAVVNAGPVGELPELPELDARAIPHAIRHATIFGALDGITVGAGILLIAPHDPLPMLRQLEKRAPGVFEVTYVERGPESWRLAIVRR